MPQRVTKADWKTLPYPTLREALGFELVLTDTDAETVMLGLLPRAMEDKWFIYYEEGWLYCHRSWTGAAIYGLRLDGSPVGVRVTDSWVSRDAQHYTETRTDYDRQKVRFLIDAVLLHRPAQFPMPPEATSLPSGAFQHHAVGTAYQEVPAELSPNSEPPDSLWTRALKWFRNR
jgi:hypothetical protein